MDELPATLRATLSRVGTALVTALRASAAAMDGKAQKGRAHDEVAALVVSHMGALRTFCELELVPERDAMIAIPATKALQHTDGASASDGLVPRATAELWCSSIFYASSLGTSLEALGWQLLTLLQ